MILGKCDCKGKIVVVISKMRIWYHSVKPRLKSLSFPLLGTVTSFSLTPFLAQSVQPAAWLFDWKLSQRF